MFVANDNFLRLPESYLFSEVARRVAAFTKANPECDIIRMDIGDVSLPLCKTVTDAITSAVYEMGQPATFHGYGPEQGYPALRNLIAENDYHLLGIHCISDDDVFVSDGAKSDIGNLGDIFGTGIRVGIPTPAYPVYIDANVMDGRSWEDIVFLQCSAENEFKPSIPAEDEQIDVIYLCYPNNPTGVALSRDELAQWIDYALRHKTLIIFDSAYEAYVRQPGIARSVYEIPEAEKVAIEVRSYSKTAGFTGVRCGYTVVPQSLDFRFADGSKANLNKMWNRRQCTKFNGVGYIVQCAAASLYTHEGKADIKRLTDYYMQNAMALREALLDKGYDVVGGVNSPYVWFRAKSELSSWQLFDYLLRNAQLTSTPGSGFGDTGDGYLRFTGFNTREKTAEAIRRLKSLSL